MNRYLNFLLPVFLAAFALPVCGEGAGASPGRETGDDLWGKVQKTPQEIWKGGKEMLEAASQGGGKAWEAVKEGGSDAWESTKKRSGQLRRGVGDAISGE